MATSRRASSARFTTNGISCSRLYLTARSTSVNGRDPIWVIAFPAASYRNMGTECTRSLPRLAKAGILRRERNPGLFALAFLLEPADAERADRVVARVTGGVVESREMFDLLFAGDLCRYLAHREALQAGAGEDAAAW